MLEIDEKVLKTIDKVAKSVSNNFSFSYFTQDDILQEARIICLEAIQSGNYDENRPLENFLYVHLRRRLINFKRDNYIRAESPCSSCPFFDGTCGVTRDIPECNKFYRWQRNNETKKNLAQPIDIGDVDWTAESEIPGCDHTDLDAKQLFEYIKRNIPISMREDFLKLEMNVTVSRKQQIKIPRKRKERLIAEIQRLKEEFYGQSG